MDFNRLLSRMVGVKQTASHDCFPKVEKLNRNHKTSNCAVNC